MENKNLEMQEAINIVSRIRARKFLYWMIQHTEAWNIICGVKKIEEGSDEFRKLEKLVFECEFDEVVYIWITKHADRYGICIDESLEQNIDKLKEEL